MRHVLTIIFSAALVILGAIPVSAGGSWLEPNRERVEPGDQLELSGDVSTGALGWADDGPFFAYLVGEDYGNVIVEGLGGAETDVPLGELRIFTSGDRARVSIKIAIPADAPPGEYQVIACNDPCTKGFGDLAGATIFVGTGPPPGLNEVANGTAVPVVNTAAPTAVSTAGIGLMLAPHPARSTNLAPAWIAVSAGLAAVVLLLVLFTRQSDTP
ncbi:MAG: hypothetical protein U9N84_00905 [Actinomycetota bacterium]|nr:hypothetical protein [Actinomycetota bacterium]